jgi:uncharacterized protein YecE (DUF72 family)
MKFFTGTSGYAYKEWKGSFYPEDLADDGMLRFYGERFRTVEINNTFYRLPKQNVLEHWAREVPDGFYLTVKASRRITHHKRLKNAEDLLQFLTDNLKVLGDKQGPVLFQTPPYLKKDVPRLADFQRQLPEGLRAAFEFRQASWEDEEVYDCLRQHGSAWVMSDRESDTEGAPSLVCTADFGYLRLRRETYTTEELHSWAERIRQLPLQEVFVYLMHEDEAPSYALTLQSLLENEPHEPGGAQPLQR